jgi:hypothetical protein
MKTLAIKICYLSVGALALALCCCSAIELSTTAKVLKAARNTVAAFEGASNSNANAKQPDNWQSDDGKDNN